MEDDEHQPSDISHSLATPNISSLIDYYCTLKLEWRICLEPKLALTFDKCQIRLLISWTFHVFPSFY